ncbi:MAG TPA: DNA-processing protein DprA [Candidatus Sulfomarinibacteraceae bacterium]|nr:DNA-processing protein DprA [Candidatus Sulfomarinibacteraceae bacterium]
MTDLKYWLGFNLVKGIGPAKLQALLDYYGDIATAWRASKADLARIGIDRRAIKTFVETRSTTDLDAYLARVNNSGAKVLTWESPDYPRYLREAPAPPPVLYVAGDLLEADRWAVAVVGTRRKSDYGEQVTRELVSGLVHNNVTIVSGLARGIDFIAHDTAVKQGGRTIGVLGSGIDHIYPPEHRNLARKIVKERRGAIISDYPLGTEPESKNFPPRNRIISGLTLGVLVIEAGKRSGALITANYALEQDREVFAVPGKITSYRSAGTNRLIQQGAKLVTQVEDILEELNLTMVPQQVAVQMVAPESAEEVALLEHLSPEPLHIDELCRASGLDMSKVSSTLALMELKGMVQQVGGMRYALLREPGPTYETDAG